MSIDIFNEKKENNLKLKENFGFQKKDKCIWLVKLSDKKLIVDLREAFVNLPVCFLIEMPNIETEKLGKNIIATSNIPEKYLSWFDFIVCDKNINCLQKYLKKGVVPIISKQNPLKTILKDFNALKNIWNSYIYESENKWLIFEALVRYLENYKFPFDNKNLVKNVLDI